MKYHDIKDCDFSNGPGVRVTIFVAGCNHGCKGCYNESTWNPNSGIEFTNDTLNTILEALQDRDGLSLSGGDPMHPRNRKEILRIIKAVRNKYPEKDIWMWTGYKFEEVKHTEIVKLIDVVIDGRYEQDNPTTKPWRGSDNQELIEVKFITA